MNFEMIAIINPKIVGKTSEEIASEIGKFFGEIAKVNSTEIWGLRKLAYPIKKHNEGYYILLKLTTKEEKPIELDEFYKKVNDFYDYMEREKDWVLKHILIRVED